MNQVHELTFIHNAYFIHRFKTQFFPRFRITFFRFIDFFHFFSFRPEIIYTNHNSHGQNMFIRVFGLRHKANHFFFSFFITYITTSFFIHLQGHRDSSMIFLSTFLSIQYSIR